MAFEANLVLDFFEAFLKCFEAFWAKLSGCMGPVNPPLLDQIRRNRGGVYWTPPQTTLNFPQILDNISDLGPRNRGGFTGQGGFTGTIEADYTKIRT